MSIRQGNKIIAGNVDNTNYTALLNKPQINSVELSGNKSLDDLGIQAKGEYATIEDTNEIKEDYNKLDNQKTNCITKIPQDIKLELSENGTLTLKSGSKVYIPNGFEEDGETKKFDEFIIENDIAFSLSSEFTGFPVKKADGSIFTHNGTYSSGESAVGRQYEIWYDITNNKIKYTSDSGATWEEGLSLPFAKVTKNSTQTLIDQVFNGFGYIDKIIYTLPGVECYIPNGYNKDGSLNNIKFNTLKIQPISPSEAKFDLAYYCIYENNVWGFSLPSNIIIKNNTIVDSYYNLKCMIACIISTDSTGHIISFNPKNIFQSVDTNNTEWASRNSMPSIKNVILELQASGSTFTAPANGWFRFWRRAGASGEYIQLLNNQTKYVDFSNSSGNYGMPVAVYAKKGETVTCTYTLTGTDVEQPIFIYAEGNK